MDMSTPLGLGPSIKLDSWEDRISAWENAKNYAVASSWVQADVYASLIPQFGEKSLATFAKEINIPTTTVTNYARTSQAFPLDKREPMLTFTHHLQASQADTKNRKGEFLSDTRFEWIIKAADEKWPVARLVTEIQQAKKKAEQNTEILPCERCGKSDGEIKTYLLYNIGQRSNAKRIELHAICEKSWEGMISEILTKTTNS